MRAILSVGVAFAVALSPGRAGATSDLPRDIQRDLGLHYLPPCSLCHDRGKTGPGTVITPFGWSMRGAGLKPRDATSLANALATLRANGTDSDGDGIPDVQELVAGTDPNSAASVPEVQPEPGYGCGGQPPVPRGASATAAPFMVACALLAARRRGRRNPPS